MEHVALATTVVGPLNPYLRKLCQGPDTGIGNALSNTGDLGDWD